VVARILAPCICSLKTYTNNNNNNNNNNGSRGELPEKK
jgi:hypothetical protein